MASQCSSIRPRISGGGSWQFGWVKTAGRSPVAYLQPGHGPTAYANPNYRRLVANAIRRAASPAAHQWARDQAGG